MGKLAKMSFITLSQFYTSREWRELRESLILTRTKEDGFLYDEHNGEKLINSYDIIAHHIQPITLANVNDYSISLNPANIMLVSHRSHNEIHARHGFKHLKKVYYIYGAPCSGKNSFVNSVKGNSDLVVDIDLIWQAITGGEKYHKPPALKSPVFILRDALLDVVKTRAGNWERCYIIEGGANKVNRERLISTLDAEPILIEATIEECFERLATDPQRQAPAVREAWAGYIENWFNSYQP